MIMDPTYAGFSDSINGYKIDDDETFFFNTDEFLNSTTNGFNFPEAVGIPFPPSDSDPGGIVDSSISLSSGDDLLVQSSSLSSNSPSTSWSPDDEFPESDGDPVLKFISQLLMEENMEQKPCMFPDPLALQATEKSLYEVLGGNPTPPITEATFQFNMNFQNLDDLLVEKGSNVQWIGNVEARLPDPNMTELLAQNIFSDSETALQFRRGLEEASKFLPSSNQLGLELVTEPVVKAESERDQLVSWTKGRKNLKRDTIDLVEGRMSKQSAIYVEETELSDLFDKVLLCTDAKGSQCAFNDFNEPLEDCYTSSPFGHQPHKSDGRRARGKKHGKRETVDLRTLLTLCAQAVSSADCRTASELLKQIRQNSSPFGDGSQRVAHSFANGLEARLDGSNTGIENFYSTVPSKRRSAVDMLKAYKVYLAAAPFKKLSYFFGIKKISDVAEKATTLHIIDYGISYGFQWPMLIQHLAGRAGGPPKLRITGIDHPQPGFRPAERLDETGRRLAKYCERFGVPFEYNSIAEQQWETIQIKDLKLDENEVLAVNCMFRFTDLLYETEEENCPRDAVLQLIRKMNPAIFVHTINNGSYNAPFFMTRFREALFHFSTLFDMFEATMSPGDYEERLMFEKEFYGRDIMNVVACEGVERVERPESYKQWQMRSMRAGLQPVPLDRALMTQFRAKLKAGYHRDFVFDEDKNWMLQGWKGRVIYASSCWVPA